MHFYSKIEIKEATTHYFVADDIPSIEIHMRTHDGFSLFLWVHPPPKSYGGRNFKGKRWRSSQYGQTRKDIKKPVIVVGDFNNVAWSRSSVLFRKTSHLIDPRIGHSFVSTFHANIAFTVSYRPDVSQRGYFYQTAEDIGKFWFGSSAGLL
ncbi:endonuclease/exonuclease/phosphatase family protein [Chryseobacterium arthrosphaerae]|uniref:Endonuclease/exonuclease/phosphatase family protein n=1 Tax=Chryseobacterium arthrosphaerae TaxID=651561 RepID=A0A432DZ02_9FLAO|nr:endonuclease/exonuclease/phosphatase family protein [Chryseobacterium arthrosphaerae]